jgi:hypothetical protein
MDVYYAFGDVLPVADVEKLYCHSGEQLEYRYIKIATEITAGSS